MYLQSIKSVKQSHLTGQLKEKPTYRVWCLYSLLVHGPECLSLLPNWLPRPFSREPVCPPLGTKGRRATLACGSGGGGSRFGGLERKPGNLYNVFCGSNQPWIKKKRRLLTPYFKHAFLGIFSRINSKHYFLLYAWISNQFMSAFYIFLESYKSGRITIRNDKDVISY